MGKTRVQGVLGSPVVVEGHSLRCTTPAAGVSWSSSRAEERRTAMRSIVVATCEAPRRLCPVLVTERPITLQLVVKEQHVGGLASIVKLDEVLILVVVKGLQHVGCRLTSRPPVSVSWLAHRSERTPFLTSAIKVIVELRLMAVIAVSELPGLLLCHEELVDNVVLVLDVGHVHLLRGLALAESALTSSSGCSTAHITLAEGSLAGDLLP